MVDANFTAVQLTERSLINSIQVSLDVYELIEYLLSTFLIFANFCESQISEIIQALQHI